MLVGQTGPGRGQRQVVWAPALLWLVENHPRRSRAGASRRGSARCGHAKTEPFRCCGIRGEGAPCGRQPGLVRRRMGVSQQSGAVALASNGSSLRATRPSNKGMKQTSVEHIGRSQLIPGVRRTEPVSRDLRGSCGQPPARRQSGEPTKLMLVGQTGPGRGQRQVVWAPALLWLVEHHPRRSRAGASRRGSARCGHAKTEPFGCCGIRGEGAPCGRQPGLVRRRMGVSQQSGAVALASNGSSLRATRPSNKGMKQTSVEHIGRSQLIPGVVRTCGGARWRLRPLVAIR